MVAVRAGQLPLVAGQQKAVGERAWSRRLIWMLRNAGAREIGRRRADDAFDRHDLARDQAGGLEIRDTQRHFEPVLHRIDLLVAEHELDLKLGILLHEIGDRGAELQRAERHRRVDAQQSARRRLQLRDRLIGSIDVGEDATARSK